MNKWEMVRLGDVTENISSGRNKARKKNGAYKVYGSTGIIGQADEFNYSSDTVLVARVGVNCGYVHLAQGCYGVSDNTLVFEPIKQKLDLKFAYYQLKNLNINQYAKGAGQPLITGGLLKSLEISLPPLDVQKKIADILDRSSALIEKRKTQIAKLDLLVKAKFVEMFGNPTTNIHGWECGTIRDVAREVKYGTSSPAVAEGRYPYLRMNNITYSGHLDTADLKHIDMPDTELEKYIVRKGDVLFNRTNSKELVGKTCVFDVDAPMVIAGYIIRIRLNDKATPTYLSAFLNSDYGKQTLRSICKAIIGQANINAQELQDIDMLIPPIELQRQFADFVRQTEKVKEQMQHGLNKLELLYKSLMQKCFNGEIE